MGTIIYIFFFRRHGPPPLSTGTPEASFIARRRGEVFTADAEGRGAVFTPRARGQTWRGRPPVFRHFQTRPIRFSQRLTHEPDHDRQIRQSQTFDRIDPVRHQLPAVAQ
jgi:hypothetical protein